MSCQRCLSVFRAFRVVGRRRQPSRSEATRENITELCRVALIAPADPESRQRAAMASEDAHTFPEATCQPRLSSDLVRRNNEGRMVSDGTTAQTWICPVARDAVDTDNGVESAQIIVVGPVASCLFHSMTENGGTVEIAPPNNIIPRDGLQSTPICGRRYKQTSPTGRAVSTTSGAAFRRARAS